MFEDEQERRQKIAFVHKEVLNYLNFPPSSLLKLFYNKDSLRLKKLAYKNLKKTKQFYEVKIDIDVFKMQDLIKISKLNSDIFYIDVTRSRIYTCDKQFSHWCSLTNGDINSIRFSI